MNKKLQEWTEKYRRLSQMQMLSAFILFVFMSISNIDTGYDRIILIPMFITSFGNFFYYKCIEDVLKDHDNIKNHDNTNFTAYLQILNVCSYFVLISMYISLENDWVIRLIYFSYFIFFHMIKPNILLREFKSIQHI